jgi:hypothetical protein
MDYFYRMGDIRMVEHVNGDDLFVPCGSGTSHVRAQLNEKKARLPRLWAPIADFGEAPNFLKQFHYSHFRCHNIHSREHDRRSRATDGGGALKR